MTHPEIIPNRLRDPINYKIIALLVTTVVILHVLVNTIDHSVILVYSWSIGVPVAIIVFGIIAIRNYSKTTVYSKAFKLLTIAFIGIFGGELTYFVYAEILNLDPYPSVGDIFYFMFYPATIGFLSINIRHFIPNYGKLDLIPLLLIPIIISGTWTSLVWGEWEGFDFAYGLASIIATSATLAFSILAFKTFRRGLIGTTWLVFVIGFSLIVVGDTWYYYLEIFEEYSLEHIVNMFWYLGYLFILYSLLKHKKII